MKVIITGGAGFIGSHLADKLIENGHKVVVIDNLSSGKKENINKKAKFYKIDVRSNKIKEVFKKERPEIVFHFAGHIEARESVKNPVFDAKINILGSLNVLENCRKFGVKKIIFASSGGEIYGDAKIIPTSEDYSPNPISPYGVAKLSVENYLHSYSKIHGINFVAVRYGNIYGPRQNPYGEAGVIAIFTNKMLKGDQPLIHGDGKQTKDYIFISDAVKATVKLSESTFNGVVNVGTGEETSVIDIFKKLKKLTKSDVKKRYIGFSLCGFKRGCLSVKRVEKIIKWKPKYNLDQGLIKTIKWFKQKNGK